MKNLESKIVNIFYNIIVILVTNYFSIILAPNISKLALNLFSQVKKLGIQLIIKIFQRILLLVAKSEV